MARRLRNKGQVEAACSLTTVHIRTDTFKPNRAYGDYGVKRTVVCIECGKEFETVSRVAKRCGSALMWSGCSYQAALRRSQVNYKKRMKRARDGNAVIRDVPRRKSILSNEIIEASYREVVADAKTEERAFAVRDRLLTLKDSIENNFFDLCELLLEAKEGEYHLIYGFERFGDWVEQGSDLDLSARSAYYYINIGEKARELGLTREMLKQAKISKLKEIFTLEPEENGDDMKRLVESASSSSLEEIKKEVAKAKEKSGVPTAAYMTLKLDPMVKDTVEEAIELARRNYGDTIDEYGEVKDASVSKCVELICVSYLQDPNNHQQE